MIYPIVIYGSQTLRNKSENITADYPDLKKLIDDMFLTLDKWYKPDYILSNAIIVCMRRENDEQNTLAIKEKELEYTKKFNAKIYFLNDDAIEISSSEIRSNIEDESVKKLLSPDVLTFINKNGLYRNE